MEKLKIKWFVWGAVLMVLSLALNIWARKFGIYVEDTHYVDQKLNVITKSVLCYPWQFNIINYLSTFCYSLSISIIITTFIVRQIDRTQTEKQKEEIKALQDAVNKDIFQSLFETLMPYELYEIIKNDIIMSKIIRKNAEWIYEFGETSEGIVCRHTLKYELHNISRQEIVNPIELTIGQSDYQDSYLDMFHCQLNGKMIATYNSKDGNTNNLVTKEKDNPDDNIDTIKVNIPIPAQAHIDMTMVLRSTYKDQVHDSYFTKIPVLNANLTVTFPESYELTVFPSFSSVLQPTLIEETRKMFKLTGGILPHQGFSLSLLKKESILPKTTAKPESFDGDEQITSAARNN